MVGEDERVDDGRLSQMEERGRVGKARRALRVCARVGGSGRVEDEGDEKVGAVNGGRGYVVRRDRRGGRRLHMKKDGEVSCVHRTAAKGQDAGRELTYTLSLSSHHSPSSAFFPLFSSRTDPSPLRPERYLPASSIAIPSSLECGMCSKRLKVNLRSSTVGSGPGADGGGWDKRNTSAVRRDDEGWRRERMFGEEVDVGGETVMRNRIRARMKVVSGVGGLGYRR